MTNLQITGVVLAGGLGRRMSADGRGTDKALTLFRGQPMIASVIDRLQPQIGGLIVNCNSSADALRAIVPAGTVFVEDSIKGFAGPLAGLHAAMQVATTEWILMVPCDSPFLPLTLAQDLLAAANATNADIATAATSVQTHPVFMLVRRRLLGSLQGFLDSGDRKIDRWSKSQAYVEQVFEDERAFANINTLEERDALQGRVHE
jgi:molybdenum cofactor guanylyltransferase